MLNAQKRRILLLFSNHLCAERGMPINKSLKFTTLVYTGKTLSQAAAWEWIEAEYERRLEAHESIGPAWGKKIPSFKFYRGDAWRSLRYDALRRAKGCCQLCGRSKRDHGIVLHVDHIKPRSLHPHLQYEPTNLQVLCEDCNLGKSNTDDTDWR